MEANHDRTEITCVPSSNSESSKNSVIPTGVNLQCDEAFESKRIHGFGNDSENGKLDRHIAKLDNNGIHLTLSYAESDAPDGNTASKGYDNSILKLDGLHYCVRYFFSSMIFSSII